MEYPPYKQSIKWNIHPINNQSNGMEYPPYKQSIKWDPPYKQSWE